MPLRPVRTVHVTTREQLDAALQAADRVVVEGDEHLLSYAVAQASSEPGNRIDLELDTAAPPPPPVPSFTAPLQAFAAPPAPIPQGFESVFAAPAPQGGAAAQAHAGSRPWILVVAVLVVVAIAGGLFAVLSRQTPPAAPQTVSQPNEAPQPPAAVAAPEPAPVSPKSEPRPAEHFASHRSDDATLIQAIAWPAVAIIAILALALIARQAIAAGRNVEFSWKVTEKVSGRVVITKVKAPSSRRSRTAPA